jgi:hypothetical protein
MRSCLGLTIYAGMLLQGQGPPWFGLTFSTETASFVLSLVRPKNLDGSLRAFVLLSTVRYIHLFEKLRVNVRPEAKVSTCKKTRHLSIALRFWQKLTRTITEHPLLLSTSNSKLGVHGLILTNPDQSLLIIHTGFCPGLVTFEPIDCHHTAFLGSCTDKVL